MPASTACKSYSTKCQVWIIPVKLAVIFFHLIFIGSINLLTKIGVFGMSKDQSSNLSTFSFLADGEVKY